MSSLRVLSYDDLHDYLESMAETEQDLADDLDDEAKAGAERHWAAADAYRHVLEHIEMELERFRG